MAILINPPILTFAGGDGSGFRAGLEQARQQWEAFKPKPHKRKIEREPLLSEMHLPYLTFHELGVSEP